MTRLYCERYYWITDWTNIQGKTPLHIAALRGNDELVRVCMDDYTCDLTDFDDTRCYATSVQILIYATSRGTPLFTSEPAFYCHRLALNAIFSASAWGHIPVSCFPMRHEAH